MLDIIWPLSVIVFSGFIIWRATDGFELASDYLGRNLSKGVKGATINAIVSSMPELLATIFFLFYVKDTDGFSGGVGVTGGSAVFNTVIIPLCVFFVVYFGSKKKYIYVKRRVFLRDGLVLLMMTAMVATVLHSETLTPIHGIILSVPYLFYLLFLLRSIETTKNDKSEPSFKPSEYLVSLKDFLYINLEKIVLKDRGLSTKTGWYLIIISTLVMMVGTWLLVVGTDSFGKALNIPLIFASVILASAASSVPDTMISMRDAKKGNYEDAFSNALGSNIFNISFALGLPLFLYTLVFEPIKMDTKAIGASTDIWFVLLVITAITLVVFSAGKKFTFFKALILLLLYLSFLLFIVLNILFDIDLTGNLFGII